MLMFGSRVMGSTLPTVEDEREASWSHMMSGNDATLSAVCVCVGLEREQEGQTGGEARLETVYLPLVVIGVLAAEEEAELWIILRRRGACAAKSQSRSLEGSVTPPSIYSAGRAGRLETGHWFRRSDGGVQEIHAQGERGSPYLSFPTRRLCYDGRVISAAVDTEKLF